MLEASERVLAAEMEPSGSGGLLDDDAAIGRTQGEHLIDETLADDDEWVVRKVRAGKGVLQIAKPDLRAVQEVLGLAVLVEPAADLDLPIVDRQTARGVVELEDRLGHPEAAAGLRSGEDELLILLRAQDARVVLTESPADRVRDITFPRAVRTDDRGDPGREFQVGPAHEALESGHRQRLEDRVLRADAAVDQGELFIADLVIALLVATHLVSHTDSKSAWAAFSCASRLERPVPRA